MAETDPWEQIMNWQKNKALAITRDNTPSLTDQGAARDTDINIIVGQFLVSGKVPGSKNPPLYGDFTELPKDLRGMIEMANSLKRNQANLPEQLRDIPVGHLLTLTPAEINAKLAPPKGDDKNKQETPKE